MRDRAVGAIVKVGVEPTFSVAGEGAVNTGKTWQNKLASVFRTICREIDSFVARDTMDFTGKLNDSRPSRGR
jgi:hypothetical protein